MTAVFKVPARAKTVVVELDGQTRVHSLPPQTATFPLRIALSPSGVRYAFSLTSQGSSTSSSAVTEVNLKYQPFTQSQRHFAPALNVWTSIPVGEAQNRVEFSFGNGQGLKVEGNKLSVNVLFTQKAGAAVSDSLRPPQKP